MKFTKEQAIEKLKAHLTNDSKKPLRMSERTLEEHAETLMSLVADDEMELDDFIAKVKGSFESVNNNVGNDVSTAIKDYEKNHPAPAPAPKDKDKTDPDVSPEMKALMDRLKALEDQETERKTKASIATKRSEIVEYLKKNNVNDEAWTESMLSMIAIGADDDVEAKGKTLLDHYNKHKASGSPSIGSPKPGDNSIVDDAFAAVRAQRKAKINN